MTVAGKTIPYHGPQAWSVASISSRGSRDLTVFAVGSDRIGGGVCGPPVVRLHASETKTRVRLLVADYQQTAAANTACPAIGYGPSPQQIRLKQPIGDRQLVDAGVGKRRVLLVGTDYPDIRRAPHPLEHSILGRSNGGASVQRVWTSKNRGSMTLVTDLPSTTRGDSPYGRIVDQITINGTPATVYVAGGPKYGVRTVQWAPNPEQIITLRLDNSPAQQWTTSQAVAAARSVTGYKTAETGRLPQPTTPGTAAASYNSADGPVKHAPQLLKSSGVYVGVNCHGAGHVDVSLRGHTYNFNCTATTSHHVVKSTGKPFDTFYVDITATPGVRWAATLARASLDGS